jgi:putative lipoprotein (rSAM/lipoprotein system)
MKNSSFKFFLAIIGFVFGFSSNVAAQYGAPPSKYKIKGCIISDNDKLPILNIQVSIKNKSNSYKTTTKSTSNGEFVFYMDENDLGDTYHITAKDIDGSEYGNFDRKDTILTISKNDIKKSKESYTLGENKEKINMFLKSEAIIPEEQNKLIKKEE